MNGDLDGGRIGSWEDAVALFLKEWPEQEIVVGALACGSHVTGNPTNHSDIDLHIVLAADCPWRERGNRIVNGFLIEYFANPSGQFKEYFREDHEDGDRSAATQFLTGRVLMDREGVIEQLRLEAAEWHAKPFAVPEATAVERAKYDLWDSLDNLKDACELETPDCAYIYHHTLRKIYETYARQLGQPIISFSKQYKCLYQPEEAKRKYLMASFPDEVFLRMLKDGMAAADFADMASGAEALTDYVLDKLGGFEIDGWKFRSPARS